MAEALAITLLLLFSAANSLADHLVILSPHWEGIRYEMEQTFKEQYKQDTGRDVSIQWRNVGGTSEILRFVESEFISRGDSIGVDIVYGGGIDPFERFKSLGLLETAAIPEELLRKIPESISGIPIYDPHRSWISTHLSAFGILCNRPALERLGIQAPATWLDLADPRFFSWVGSADPRKSGSVHMSFEIFLQAYGWQEGWRFIQALGRNVRSFSGNSSQSVQDVATGEIACAPAIDSYAWSQSKIVGEGKLIFVLPGENSVISGDGVGILKGAPNKAVADSFVRFLLSDKAQRLLLLPLGDPEGPKKYEMSRLSLNPELYQTLAGRTEVKLNPFAYKLSFRYDPLLSLKRWRAVNELIGTFIIEGHKLLKEGMVLALPEEREVDSQLSDLEDPVKREEIITRWKNQRGSALSASPISSGLPMLLLVAIFGFTVVFNRFRN